MKKLIALSLFCSILIVGCKSKKEVVAKKDTKIEEKAEQKLTSDSDYETYNHNQMPTESEGDILQKKALAKLSDSLVARIQRTACFGRCPIYTASIYKSGYVDYMGEKWVEREGKQFARISKEKIDALLAEAKKIEFQKMNTIYDSKSVTDLPSTIITLRFEEGPKIVVNRYQGPEELSVFARYFDQMIEELKFTPVSYD